MVIGGEKSKQANNAAGREVKAPASSRALPSNPSPYQDAKLHLGRLFGAVIDYVHLYKINDIGAGGEQGRAVPGVRPCQPRAPLLRKFRCPALRNLALRSSE